jgi:murein DD-endopeptidase MepM/ murein hydrolase activator NlpD
MDMSAPSVWFRPVSQTRRLRLPLALLSLLLLFAVQPAAGATEAPRAAGTGFVLPVPAPPLVLTPFAPPANPYGAGHRGVDLAAQPGSPVVAAGPGAVVFAGNLAGRGVVSIEHTGGLRTTYEPVTASVSAGSMVDAGRLIGVLEPGHAGCAPADCLHWGARLPDRVYLDPMSLLGPWRVRLLPWDGR